MWLILVHFLLALHAKNKQNSLWGSLKERCCPGLPQIDRQPQQKKSQLVLCHCLHAICLLENHHQCSEYLYTYNPRKIFFKIPKNFLRSVAYSPDKTDGKQNEKKPPNSPHHSFSRYFPPVPFLTPFWESCVQAWSNFTHKKTGLTLVKPMTFDQLWVLFNAKSQKKHTKKCNLSCRFC